MEFTFYEAAQAVSAKNDYRQWADFSLNQVEFDSRKIGQGDLFIPLAGARDGHEFVTTAIENGAGAIFWQEDQGECPYRIPHLVVEQTLTAMQQLANVYLTKKNPKVVAITGSNGKTTTKDMTAAVLATHYKVYKTQGNYNNHIGLPYTILHMPKHTEVLVLELGMDRAGEIAVLAEIAPPDVAAITMIGESHIEHLGSREAIAAAKLELTTFIKADGCLVIPAEEPLLDQQLLGFSHPIYRVGFSSEAQLQAVDLQTKAEETTFSFAQFPGISFVIPVLGKYNVSNALIAAQIGLCLQVPIEKIRQGLAAVQLTQNRSQWLSASNGAQLLSDVYNANPTAMALVLDAFSDIPSEGRKMTVLADMLDLGEYSDSYHVSMADHLSPEKVQEVWLYGDKMRGLYERLQEKYTLSALHYYPLGEKAQMIAALKETLLPTDKIVLKGSNGLGLAEVVEELKN